MKKLCRCFPCVHQLTQPLVIALSMWLLVLYDGISILNADGIH